MWAQVRKFAPLAAIAGYLYVYSSAGKGWDRLVTDLQNISIERLQSKMGQIAVIAGAAIGLYVIGKIKIPAVLKMVVIVALYLLIGYNAGLVIDPVGCGARGEPACNTGTWVQPKTRNPYSPGAK